MDHFRGQSFFPSAAYVGKEGSKDEWDECPQYPKYTPSDHRNSCGSNSGGNRTGCSLQNWHKEEAAEDPDGQTYEPNEEDPELTRKRKELQEIEKQIMRKRAFLALNTVNPVHHTEEARPSKSNQSLQDRIKLILRQRNRVIRSQDPVAKVRRSSINIQHNHPLKQRVKDALEQRFVVDQPVEAQNTEQINMSPVEEEEQGNQGFMRFLNILNKGVDIDKLKEMVNDNTESTMPEPHSSQKWGKTLSETIAFDSPPVEAQQQPKDEQQKHLQNILKSLGLSLGTDEMRKLADRTQERLYGKKPRTEEVDRKEIETQQKGEEKYSPAHYTRTSSSSSNSSSSTNASPPRKQSPQRRQRSRSSSRRRRSRSSSRRRRSRSSSRRRRCRSSSRRRRSRSSSRRRTSTSSSQRVRSPYSSPRRRRQSRSPYRHRNSNSPYRRTDSHSSCRHGSPHSRDHGDPPLQFHQYPNAPSLHYNPHYPPQMHSYPYSQYAPYYNYNYCAYSQPTIPGLAYQNYPQTVPPASPNQQLEPQNSNSLLEPHPEEAEFSSNQLMDGLPDIFNKTEKTRCLLAIKLRSIYKRNKSQRSTKLYKAMKREWEELRLRPPIPISLKVNEDQSRTTEMNNAKAAVKVGMNPNLISLVEASQPSKRTQIREAKKEKYRMKARLKKKRKKLSQSEGTLNGSTETTNAEGGEEEKPTLTEQQIKANLKLKLEAFNSRMKKPIQPAQSLMPQNIKEEDEI